MKENKLIAEFMGLPYKMRDEETKLYYKVCEIPYPLQREHLESTYEEINLKYHTSWDWLMPVVEKIEQVHEGVPQELINLSLFSTIDEVYNAVVEFIKRYNEDNERFNKQRDRVMRDNKLIVEFLGYENIGTDNEPMYTFYDNYFEDGNRDLEELCYHKSWDWLMPVVESIERLGYEFFIVENRVKVAHNTDHSIETIIDLTSRSKLNATYNAVVEFINQLNK